MLDSGEVGLISLVKIAERVPRLIWSPWWTFTIVSLRFTTSDALNNHRDS